jgi:hypothetical protein
MTILTTYWCFLVIFGLAAVETLAAGIENWRRRPEASPTITLAGPKRVPRRRDYQTSA